MTELERFLIDRYLRDRMNSSEVGASSNSMLREAILGEPIASIEYPLDLWDLSRCCATFASAPYDLKERMLPRLLDYCECVGERTGLLPLAVVEPKLSRWSRFLNWMESGWRARTARFS